MSTTAETAAPPPKTPTTAADSEEKPKIRIVGITGSFQTGKRENAKTYERHGWHLININPIIRTMRLKGSPWHDEFEQLMPGAVGDNGATMPAYYAQATKAKIHRLFDSRWPQIVAAANEEIQRQAAKGKIKFLIATEYLEWFGGATKFERVMLFRCDSDTWYNRLCSRASGLGLPCDFDSIEKLMTEMEMHTETHLARIRAKFSGVPMEFVDVSKPAWGSAAVELAIAGLG